LEKPLYDRGRPNMQTGRNRACRELRKVSNKIEKEGEKDTKKRKKRVPRGKQGGEKKNRPTGWIFLQAKMAKRRREECGSLKSSKKKRGAQPPFLDYIATRIHAMGRRTTRREPRMFKKGRKKDEPPKKKTNKGSQQQVGATDPAKGTRPNNSRTSKKGEGGKLVYDRKPFGKTCQPDVELQI